MVVVTHAIESLVRHDALDKQHYQLAWFFGWVGVTTFFMISGLILIRTSWSKFQLPNAAPTFLIRRVIRIVPLYWFATALFAVEPLLRGPPLTLEHVLKSLFFIPYTSSEVALIRPIAGQGWTLDYEMWFYLIFSTCLLLPRRAGVGVLVAVPVVLVALGTLIRPLFPFHDATSPLQFCTDPILLAFSASVLIGVFESRMPTWHRFAHPVAGAIVVFGVALVAGGLIDPGYQLPIYGICCAIAVLLCTSASTGDDGPVGRTLEAGGDASFSTYLFHPFVITILGAIASRVPILYKSPVVIIIISVIAANLVGFISYRLLERQLETWLKPLAQRWFTGMPRASVAAKV